VLLAGVVEGNAQVVLWQFTQWLWIEHPTFQLGGGHFTTDLMKANRTFPNPSLYCTLVTSTANMSTGVKAKHLLMVRAWTPGQHPTTLDCCMAQRKHLVSLTDGTSAQTRAWLSLVSARAADCRTDVF